MSFKQELLQFINDAGGFTEKMLTHQLRIGPDRPSRYYTTLSRMESQGLISKKKQGRKIVSVQITEKGKRALRKNIQRVRRTDGLATLIIFDIPEEKRRARENLRRYLLRNGYTLLQKSVLVSPYQIDNQLKALIRELNIRLYTTVIAGKIIYNF